MQGFYSLLRLSNRLLTQRCSHCNVNLIRTIVQITPDSANQEVHEVTIPVPWGYVAGKWWGDKTKQPIVALHGIEDNAATFDRLIPQLQTNGVPVFAIDFPGHGKSDHLPCGVAPHYTDVIVFVRNLLKYHYSGWKDLTLLGHSFGSSVCLAYSAIYPDDVRNLISIECAWFGMSKNTPESMRKTLEKTLKYEKLSNEPPAYTFEELSSLLHKGRKERLTLDSCKILLSRGVVPSKNDKDKVHLSRDLITKLTALGKFSVEFWNVLASRIKANVLIIEGSSGLFKTEEPRKQVMFQLDLLTKTAKKVEHSIVDGGHHVHLDDPLRVAPIINSFLAHHQKY